MKVLSVDDRPESRYLLELQLGAQGFQVVSASNGAEALALLEREAFDAVLTDILMPQMDGFQLCREVKRRPALRDVPVVFYTATYTDPKDEQVGLSLGASRFLLKPSEPEVVARALREAVAEGPRAAPPTAGPEEAEHLEAYNERLVKKLDEKVGQLERTTRALREVFDHTSDVILVFGVQGDELALEAMNRRAEEALERPAAGALGATPEAALGAERGARLRAHARASAASGAPARYEEVLGAGPRARTFEVLVSPVRVADGRVERVSVFARDVTARLAVEAAQKLECVGRLATGVAHDFNNLLTAVLGHSELTLARLAPGDPLRGGVEQIRRAADRAAALTRQLLLFARRDPPARRPLDLNAVVVDLEPMLGRLLGADVRLEVAVDRAVGWIEADAGQVEQVVVNLCVNARDAMPEGGRLRLATAEVTLADGAPELRGAPSAGRYVALEVEDAGCGMPPEVLARVFEPFFTTKERGRGTGLGLATVWGIVEGAGGCVTVTSEVGRGTTFRVLFPRAAPGAAGDAHPGPPAPRPAAGEAVLLVEDDPALRALLEEVLAEGGYAVLPAGDGAEALAAAARAPAPIALLLTDLVMPGMSGAELAARLTRDHPGLRVLFASGYGRDLLEAEGALRPEHWFLQKPFTPLELLRQVREALDAPAAAG